MKRFFILVLLVLSLPLAAWAQGAPMAASNGAWTDLGSLGAGSIAYGVSPKGDVVMGISATQSGIGGQYDRGFRWTAAGGIYDLDANPDDGVIVRAYGISADASTIVGWYAHYPECNPGCAFQWTAPGGFYVLPDLPSSWYNATGAAVSKDGGVIVGWASQSYGGPDHAWRYTGLTGFVDLGNLPGSCCGSHALAVSQDGSTIVGWSTDANMYTHAVLWTYKNGAATIKDLGFLPGGPWSEASGVSANGKVVVGTGSCGSYCNIGFRWTKATGLVPIPIPAPKTYAYATGVSSDGKTVVGYAAQNCCDWQAWRWTAATGTQYVSDWLADVGVDTTGASFYSAYAATANGYGVVGQLTNGDAYLALATSNKTGMPTFSPKPGTYHGSVTVTLNHTSPNASIYYTTDGSTPTKNSTPYTTPIQVTVTTTIKAIAIVPSYPQSAVATGKYTIK